MLMSKSRLEKFLYALYSLDSSDLPNPLSRIEELYKCWVTGEEVPTFKPLSRVEKYLMAILGAYNVNELPNPISRVEVLLHKLATGDDSLEDFDTFLSEHEELLAGIIRNGGVGGNIDIEYVLHTLSTGYNTLYNTAEKPVKSAILKGMTLVNICPKFKDSSWVKNGGGSPSLTKTDDYMILSPSRKSSAVVELRDVSMFKQGTVYTFIINVLESTFTKVYFSDFSLNKAEQLQIGINKFTQTFNNTSPIIRIGLTGDVDAGSVLKIANIVAIEGDHTSKNITYFEGMQSVKMPVLTTTGKNLLNNQNNSKDTTIDEDGTVRTFVDRTLSDYVKVSKSKQYVFSGNGNSGGYVAFFDNSKTFIERIYANTFSPKQDGYVRVFQYTSAEALYQIEEGSVATAYTPFKSNILTTSEEVELHGVGEVKDELDLVTGEVTQRIGEVVFDGSEDWVQSGMGDPGIFYTSINDMAHKENYRNSISCDKFVTTRYEGDLMDSIVPNGITGYLDNTSSYPNENWLYIKLADSEGSVEKLKQWLSQNPVTVRYELTMESVKTVDLSVVDQDGNNTKLKSFDDITYVTLSSEGLIPEAEMEVATKNEEILSTLSLEMDDISTAQTTLEKTSNTQSENVDATMIATTEIYEGLL